jgi:hypothetical protein
VGPTAGLDDVETDDMILVPTGTGTPQPVARRYTDCAVAALMSCVH